MDGLARFEIVGDRAVFRPIGRVSLEQAVQVVKSAIAFAYEQRIRKLLVDATALTGFEPPSLGARYFLVREWAEAARGAVRLALVVRPEMLDGQRFGVTVATNAVLTANGFISEQEALAWLELAADS